MPAPAVVAPEVRSQTQLLIVFADLTGFTLLARTMSDAAIAEFLDQLYERVALAAQAGGGRVVKFIGDAALVVFSETDVDRGVNALLDLKDGVDDWLREAAPKSRLIIKAHFGPVVCGPFGARGAKQFDVIGNTVNIAARLESPGCAISPQVFRKLSAQTRKRFKKHTPPIVYLPLDSKRS